jgi:hypothetical protein
MNLIQNNSNVNTQLAYGVYINIQPPKQNVITGAETDIIGFVGTAIWGPENSPVVVGSLDEYVQNFGNPQTPKYDMGTHVTIAGWQGANNFRCVRVTDGTAVAASALLLDNAGSPTTGLTVTALYKGTLGNTIQVTVSAGSSASTYRLVIARPNYAPEVFDNISGSGNTLWVNMAAAINLGQSLGRGPSQLVTAAAGVSTDPPSTTTLSYTLTSGANGGTITATNLIGSDTYPRTGMYALRNTGVNILDLCDNDTVGNFSNQITFGLSEGTYAILTGTSGQTPSAAATAKSGAAIDSYTAKYLLGDYCYFLDTNNNGITRLISQQPFIAGLLATLGPNISGLNKPVYGIIATQTSVNNRTYSQADRIFLQNAGIDVIATPSPGGANQFTPITGQNTSSVELINDDNYTRMTYYLAASIYNSVGVYIGQNQSPTVQLSAKNSIQSFLQGLADGPNPVIGDVNGGEPFSVIVQASEENPYVMLAFVRVVTFKTIRIFLVNLENGDISITTSPNNQ